MMNCVEKIAPIVPMVQATIVGPPIVPDQVKYSGGKPSIIGRIPPVANSANSRKPIEAPMTDQAAAKPEVNASCAVPTVDLAPTNSDMSSTPTTAGGSARAAVMN